MNTTTTHLKGQDPMLDQSCHLALDLMGLMATGLGDIQRPRPPLQEGFDKVVRSLEAMKTITRSKTIQQKQEWMAALEQIKKIQARYAPSNKGRVVKNTTGKRRMALKNKQKTYDINHKKNK